MRRNDIYEAMLREHVLRDAAGKRVLVTGATGMVGSLLVHALTAVPGVTAYAVARTEAALQRAFGGGKAIPISRNVASRLDDLPAVDCIIHAASPAGPNDFAANPAGVVSANLAGTLNLLEKARRDNARLLFVSSHEVYGAGRDVWREGDFGVLDFLSPRACYPESKRAAENACVCFWREYGVDARIVRPSRIYGPGMNLDGGLFVCDFFKDALAGRDICIRGGGGLLRPLCHVRDAAAGLFSALFLGEPGGVYNLAPDESPAIREIAAAIAGLAGVGVREEPGEARGGSVQDATRLKSLGWRAEIPLAAGLAETWAALSEPRERARG